MIVLRSSKVQNLSFKITNLRKSLKDSVNFKTKQTTCNKIVANVALNGFLQILLINAEICSTSWRISEHDSN